MPLRGVDGSRFEFTYDTELRLTRVTNPAGLTWSYTYDACGRLVEENDFNNRTLQYEYDACGRLLRALNGAGEETRYEWDVLDQPLKRWTTNPDGQGDGEVTSYEFDLLGRLTRASSPGVELRLERDAAGRVLAESVNGRRVVSVYDRGGRRIARSTPAGVSTAYTYDQVGQLSSLDVAGEPLEFSRDHAGRVTAMQYAHALVGQTWTPTGLLETQTVTTSTPHHRQVQYNHDTTRGQSSYARA